MGKSIWRRATNPHREFARKQKNGMECNRRNRDFFEKADELHFQDRFGRELAAQHLRKAKRKGRQGVFISSLVTELNRSKGGGLRGM